jgi:hypothetical protein
MPNRYPVILDIRYTGTDSKNLNRIFIVKSLLPDALLVICYNFIIIRVITKLPTIWCGRTYTFIVRIINLRRRTLIFTPDVVAHLY